MVTWDEFLQSPSHELHDGVAVDRQLLPPLHIKLQKRIERLLETVATGFGVVTIEFPYRPAANLQYWFADVAYVPQSDWDALPPDQYPIYAPPLIVEVLSPSNTTAKLNRQRIVAMSAGTLEFWVVDPENRTVQVTDLSGTRSYAAGDHIAIKLLAGAAIAIDDIFAY